MTRWWLVSSLVLGLLSACDLEAAFAPAPFEGERPDQRAFARAPAPAPDCTLPGVYDAQLRHDLRAPVDGRLDLLETRAGLELDAETVVARIVDPRASVEVAESSAALRVLEVEGELTKLADRHARDELEVLRGVQDYVARDELRVAERKAETTATTHRLSLAQLDRGRAEQASAEQRGAMGELTVEFDAVVVALVAEPGEWVTAGQAILVVADRGARRVNVLIDPSSASRLTIGGRVEVERMGEFEGRRVALPILRIGSAVIDDTGLVELSLDARALAGVRLGEAVRVHAPWHTTAWCTGT